MSKPDLENPKDVQEITVTSASGVSSIEITPALEHQLLRLNVNDHKEEKNGLSYLSWAWAWAEALKTDPAANFEVHHFDGKPYMDVNGTAMVVVSVTMRGIVRTCHLPVMNSRNDPILVAGRTYKDKYGREQVERVDAFNVNTAIMRCLTKALAMFGLGLYIYAGEDLPEADEDLKPVATQKEEPRIKDKTSQPPAQMSDQEAANLKLFSDSMIQFIGISKTEKDLRSYWKANQTTIDALKTKMPDEYQRIVGKFQEAKASMTGETNE